MAYKAFGDLATARCLLGTAGLKADCRLSPLGISIQVRVYMGCGPRSFSIKLPKYADTYAVIEPGIGLVEFATMDKAVQEIINRVRRAGECGGR